MVEQVHRTQRDDIAVLTLDRAPGNVLTPQLRDLLSNMLKRCCEAPDTKAIVLAGAGRGFCPGVDITEYNGDLGTPWVADLCDQIETAPKPIVAAVHGGVMGAGLELALAAHARVAHRDARLAMPDVKLGMIPGGGATQRLPRLLGAQGTLSMLLGGQVMHASDPRLGRLINQLSDSNPIDAAIELARALHAKGHWPRSRDQDAGFSDPEGFQAALSAIRAQMKAQDGASGDILRCVEAAQLLPFEQGVAFEGALFRERLASPKARGSRHFLMAEKLAAAPPGSARGQGPQVRHVTLMGRSGRLEPLAQQLLRAGFGVSLICAQASEADALAAGLARALQSQVKRGQMDQAKMQACLDLLDHKRGVQALGMTDLVIEDGSITPDPWPELQPHTIWAVLEPAADAAARSGALGLRKAAIGLHPYTPLSTRQCVELTLGTSPEPGDVAAVMDVVLKLNKSPVLTSMQAGRLRARLSSAIFAAALQLVRHGAHPYAVDRALQASGFAAGPFEMMDQVGLAQVKALLAETGNAPDLAALPEHLLANGRTGRGAGQGIYLYQGDRRREDPALDRLLPAALKRPIGLALDDGLLRSAIFGALANETVRIMQDKRLRRVSDIDLVLVKGFGFDRSLGGPLLQIDLRGVFYLFKEMQRLEALSSIWAPEAALVDMVKQGEGFFGRSVG